MKFNNYIWSLYQKSDEGKKDIEIFKNLDIDKLSKKFASQTVFKYTDENKKIQDFYPYLDYLDAIKEETITNKEQAKELFKETVIDNIKDAKYNYFMHCIAVYSTALFKKFPDYFLPFYYNSETYPDFVSICENLEITLPQLPTRRDWNNRTLYYFELCETLHNFRRKHNIDSTEFPALLYSFGLKIIEKTEEEDLPKPSRIYFLGAGAGGGKEEDNEDFIFLDNVNRYSTCVWGAGNLNIKKGDLVLLYCVSPRKYLHSIWRAVEDSFIDPFRFHYFCVKVGYPQKIKPIGYHELKENSVFKRNSTVKSQMQGMNGRPLTVQEYAELQKMIKKKGQNTDSLLKLPVYEREVDHIEIERDVEQQLIEPLLKDLGFKENDWIRQLPLRMGRQTKYYPDYAIKVNSKRGKEKAQIILEAKYSINSDNQLKEAFDQARSYGLRLQSEKIMLADRDFIWVYKKTNGDFDSIPILRMHWNELTDSDNLYKLKEKLK